MPVAQQSGSQKQPPRRLDRTCPCKWQPGEPLRMDWASRNVQAAPAETCLHSAAGMRRADLRAALAIAIKAGSIPKTRRNVGGGSEVAKVQLTGDGIGLQRPQRRGLRRGHSVHSTEYEHASRQRHRGGHCLPWCRVRWRPRTRPESATRSLQVRAAMADEGFRERRLRDTRRWYS